MVRVLLSFGFFLIVATSFAIEVEGLDSTVNGGSPSPSTTYADSGQTTAPPSNSTLGYSEPMTIEASKFESIRADYLEIKSTDHCVVSNDYWMYSPLVAQKTHEDWKTKLADSNLQVKTQWESIQKNYLKDQALPHTSYCEKLAIWREIEMLSDPSKAHAAYIYFSDKEIMFGSGRDLFKVDKKTCNNPSHNYKDVTNDFAYIQREFYNWNKRLQDVKERSQSAIVTYAKICSQPNTGKMACLQNGVQAAPQSCCRAEESAMVNARSAVDYTGNSYDHIVARYDDLKKIERNLAAAETACKGQKAASFVLDIPTSGTDWVFKALGYDDPVGYAKGKLMEFNTSSTCALVDKAKMALRDKYQEIDDAKKAYDLEAEKQGLPAKADTYKKCLEQYQ